MIKTQTEALSFSGLGIAPRLLDILTQLNYTTPTPIQVQSIPTSLEGKDLVGIAQTGTGKTLAFGIPMLQLLATNKGKGLVVLPTRELALQVDESLRVIGNKIGLRTAVLIGGEAMGRQLFALRRNPHIIVATPGRLADHAKRGTVKLNDVKILVLDEADMMLDMGFLPQIKEILKLVPKNRQTMLFSATMPNQIMKIAAEYMALPIRIEVAPAGTAAENVEHEIIVIDRDSKFPQLKKILEETKGSVLMFCRTKHSVKNLTQKIRLAGFSATEIHSNRSLVQRRAALNGFKLGQFRVLVATDIAARGIDVKGIELVINYDLPENSEDYVHRIGRTGRAGQSGKAISFALPSQMRDIRAIERLIKKTLNITRPNGEALDPASMKQAFARATLEKYVEGKARRTGRGGARPARFAERNVGGVKHRIDSHTNSRMYHSPKKEAGGQKPYEEQGKRVKSYSRPGSSFGSKPGNNFGSKFAKPGGKPGGFGRRFNDSDNVTNSYSDVENSPDRYNPHNRPKRKPASRGFSKWGMRKKKY
ncbi:MAG: DEAD/DEAH box helicase [Patescibacteria group bacterium]|jgi:ATP-dependent RNA helicase RhlE